MAGGKTAEILGGDANFLLNHESKTIDKSALHLPGPDFVERVFAGSDRPVRMLRSLQTFFNAGDLLWNLIGCKYYLVVRTIQSIKCVEELLLGTLFSTHELNVVDKKELDTSEAILEFIHLPEAKGLDKVICKCFR